MGATLVGACPIVVMWTYMEAKTWTAYPSMLPSGVPEMLLFATMFTAMPVFLLGSLGGCRGLNAWLLASASGFSGALGGVLAVLVILFAKESYGATVIGPALAWSALSLGISGAAGVATGRRVQRSKTSNGRTRSDIPQKLPYGLVIFFGACACLLALSLFTDVTRSLRAYLSCNHALLNTASVSTLGACSLVAYGGQRMLGTPRFGSCATAFVLISALFSIVFWAPFAGVLFTSTGCRRTTYFGSYYMLISAVSLAYPIATCLVHQAIWSTWEYRGTCRRCRYDMRGLPAPRCPECGWEGPAG